MTRTIEVPLKYNEAIAPLVELSLNGQAEQAWSAEQAEPFRRLIKAKCVKHQKRVCCYCQQSIPSRNFKHWELDHVLPKSKFPQFAFELLNLAVACPDCNNFKANKQVSRGKSYRRLPKRSDCYLIVHPVIDRFNDHVIRKGFIYVPKTDKGRRTIEVCNLLRYAVEFIDWENPASEEEVDSKIDEIVGSGVSGAKLRKLLRALVE
jgi:hypothetical protein